MDAGIISSPVSPADKAIKADYVVEADQNGQNELLPEVAPSVEVVSNGHTDPAVDIKSVASNAAAEESAPATPPALLSPPAPSKDEVATAPAAATSPPTKPAPAAANGNGVASAALSPATPALPDKASDSATPAAGSGLRTSISKRSSSGVPPLSPSSNTASPAPAQADIISPSISVKELRKQLSTAADSPAPTPGAKVSNSGSGITSPTGPAPAVSIIAPGQKLNSQRSTKESHVPNPPTAVRSEHDLRNTTNAAQLLKLGAFKLQPLKDFVAYDELVKLRLEDGIDPTRKEDYLTEDEFKKVMGMTREAYTKLPVWRKTDAKKRTHLW